MHHDIQYYHTSRCPQCHCVEGRYSSDDDFLFGTPRRQCPQCKHIYFDGFFLEKALNYNLFNNECIAPRLWAGLTLVSVCVDLLFFIYRQPPYPLLTLLIVCALSLTCIVMLSLSLYRWKRHYSGSAFSPDELERRMLSFPDNYDIVESARRMADPDYLFFLMENGVDVPEYFFQRLDTPYPIEEIRRYKAEKAQTVNRKKLRDELEYYEYCLSLGAEDPSFRQMAAQQNLSPKAFESHCRKAADKLRHDLANTEQ